MKPIVFAFLLASSFSFAQNTVVVLPPQGGVVPAPDIVGASQHGPKDARVSAANAQLLEQQAALLQQQIEALKKQNAALAQQKQFIPAVRKPRIDDVDSATGKPRFATYADYEDAKDEWLIDEAVRRFEALHRGKKK